MLFASSSGPTEQFGFEVPDWLQSDDISAEGPTILLADSAGANIQGLFAACRLACDDIGQSARLLLGDDARDPAQAAALAEAACGLGIDCCIGHFGTRTAIPASRVYGRRNVLFLAPGTSGDGLCHSDAATTLRFFGRDSEQRACLVTAARQAGPVVAIFGQRANSGEGLAEALAAELEILQPRIHIHGTPDVVEMLSGDIANLASAIVCGSKEFAQDCVCRLRSRWPHVAVMLSDDSFGTDFSLLAEAAGATAVAFLDESADCLIDQDLAELRRRARALLPRSVGAYFETSYLAVRAFLKVWGRYRNDRGAWQAALLTEKWQTPFGLLHLSTERNLTGHRWAMRALA